MKTVLFRADASSEIGFGHVSRCLAIAANLKQTFDCVLLTRLPNPGLIERCQTERVTCLALPADVSPENEATYVGEQAVTVGASVVCLDGYAFDQAYQTSLKAEGLAVALVDDLKSNPYRADLIINHAPGTKPADYQTIGPCSFLLGLDGLMLHPDFWQQDAQACDDSVFVCLGGADPSGSTLKVLNQLVPNDAVMIRVVLGGINAAAEAVRATYADAKNVCFLSALSSKQMAATMARSAFGVCASSTVALEYLVTGRNLLVMKTADNQAGIHAGLIGLGLAKPFEGSLPCAPFAEPRKFCPPDFCAAFGELFE